MNVTAWSENLTSATAAAGARLVSKAELLRTADVVSIQRERAQTAQPHEAADGIAHVRYILVDYIAACSAHDADGITRTTASDAVLEYALDESGQYLSVDMNTTSECWRGRHTIDL